MSRPIKPIMQGGGTANITGKFKPSESDAISNNLWVGNLAPDVTDVDLKNVFEKHGPVDSVTIYPLRNYAFMYLKRAEDAKRAREALQGAVLRGSPLKIEFAKPDLGLDFHEPREGQQFRSMAPLDAPWLLQDPLRNHTDLRIGLKRPQHILPLDGRKRDGEQPSNVLFISYPPTVHIDEQMLHNAMILFGEIEKIRNFPLRHHSFVEFRSVEEAQRAKDGLQGKLFNDPRISITFSTTPNHDFTGFIPRSDTLFNELPFQAPQLDVFGHPPVPNSFHGRLTPRGLGGPDIPMRPFTPLGNFEPMLPGPDLGALDPIPMNPIGGHRWRSSPTHLMISSPSAGINPLPLKPSPGTWDVFDASQIQREPKRLRTESAVPLKETKDRILGADHTYRGVPQVKGVSPVHTRFPAERDQPEIDYMWRGIIAKGGSPVCRARCVPIGDWIGYEIPEVVNCSARTGLDLLAKHYADAVGFDIIFFLPDSEDDFASYTEFLRYLGDRNRAGVAKFDDGTTLFLVPPSEFLTNVLNVSGPERLYGVILKFPQNAPDTAFVGTSISQPPYAEKLTGPSQNEYGFGPHDDRMLQNSYGREYPKPRHDPRSPLPSNPQPPPSNHQPLHLAPPDTPTTTPQVGLSLTPELIATLASLAKVNSNGPQGGSTVGPVLTSAPEPRPHQGWEYERETPNWTGHLTQQVGATFHSQSHIPLHHQTYPSNMVNDSQILPHHQTYPSTTVNGSQIPPHHQTYPSNSVNGSQIPPHHQTYPSNAVNGPQIPPHHQTYPSNVVNGSQILPHHQTYPSNVVNNDSQIPPHHQTYPFNDSHLPVSGRHHIQDHTFNVPQNDTNPTFQTPAPGGHFGVPGQAGQQYRPDFPHDTHPPSGFEQKPDTPSVVHPGTNPFTSLSQGYGANAYQPQNMVVPPAGVENPTLQLPEQVQQHQSALYGANQQTMEFDADKNERYQSTLQFAANLLLQIHQKQPGTQAGPTDGNH